MSTLLSVDPGNIVSGWTLTDPELNSYPLDFGLTVNGELRSRVLENSCMPDRVVIEMIASYGMAVGQEVFDTCVWIGRFFEQFDSTPRALVKRLPVKLHHCHAANATDANIRRALLDRFAPGVRNYGKGSKANPGWFYGFSKDIWAAYALSVYAADNMDSIPWSMK